MTPEAMFRGMRTFSSLDGLRCLAILAVVFHHTAGDRAGWILAKRGFLGVDLFFVVSGFLIVTLLLRERRRSGAISLRAFYARRALRIMPLYYAVLAVCALVFGVLHRTGNMGAPVRHDLPYCLTYTSNWVTMASFLGITWSLSAEEQFYLFWPPIERYVARPALALALVLSVSVVIQLGLADGILHALLGLGPTEPTMLHESTFTPILLGVLVAHVLDSERGFAGAFRLLSPRWTPLAVLAGLALGLAWFPEDLRGAPRALLHVLLALLVASTVVREDHCLTRVLTWLPVRRIGAVSYGIYLLHLFVVAGTTALTARGMPGALQFPVVTAITWALAETSYRLFETRFLRLRERFRDGGQRSRSAEGRSSPLGPA